MSKGKLGGLLDKIFSKKGGGETPPVDKDRTKFEATFPGWDTQAQLILTFTDPRMPDSLKDLKAEVKTAHDDTTGERDGGNYGEALKELETLKAKVAPALLAKKKHLAALKEYDAAIKTLRPRDEAAKKIKTPPPDNLKDLHDKYTEAKNAVLDAQNKRDYPDAVKKVKTLAGAIDKLLAKRLPDLLKDVDTAVGDSGTKDGAKDVVEQLAPEEIAKLGAQKQVGLLKKLRSGGEPTGAHFDARCKIYVSTPMDAKFVKADTKRRKKIVKDLKKDPKFQDAKAKWDTAYTEEDKKKFLEHAAKKQCEAMGHTGTDPVLTFIRNRKCRNTWDPCADNCRDGNAVEWDVDDSDEPQACPTCGDANGFYGSMGQCDGGAPATIEVNTDSKLHQLDNFGEILDTVIHENTHAYQNKLIKDLNDGTLKEGDPEYEQALLFRENEQGYVDNDNNNPLQAQAYQHEPLEIHAMTMGPLVRDGLLGPRAEEEEPEEADLT
jgi:hypothetical protein